MRLVEQRAGDEIDEDAADGVCVAWVCPAKACGMGGERMRVMDLGGTCLVSLPAHGNAGW